MTRDEAKRAAHERMAWYLQSVKGVQSLERAFRCLNPAHEDRNPSMHFDRQRNRVKCFACGESYDVFDLVRMDEGLTDMRRVFDRTYEILGFEVGEKAQASHREDDYLRKARERIGQTDYPARRGIGEVVVRRMGLGFDPAFSTKAGDGQYTKWQALVLPGSDGVVLRNTQTDARKNDRIRKRGKPGLYNVEALREKGPVFVVEGEFDCLSVLEAGAQAVALGSVANVRLLLGTLDAMQNPVGERAHAQPLLIAMDNDTSGEKARDALLAGLEARGIAAQVVQIAEGYNDPNEALCADRNAFVEAVQSARDVEARARERARERYLQTCAGAHVQAFVDRIAGSADTPAYSTGFAQVDAALDGGLFEGLYILGAITSLGKTTFAMQVADQIAMQGQDVLVFSLEMARSELMAKSISRLTSQHCLEIGDDIRLAKTTRGIMAGKRYRQYSPEEMACIQGAVKEYMGYADRLFIQEGIGDIGPVQVRRTVETHVEVTGNRPVVLVDYLQILAPYSDRMSDKQNTDRAVLELKRISRDFELPVIGISSFNRQNYTSPVKMESFKESGAIEYSSDVLLGLQLRGAGTEDFDVTEEKARNPRAIELKVLKNRNGVVGESVAFEYYAMFNMFREEKRETVKGKVSVGKGWKR